MTSSRKAEKRDRLLRYLQRFNQRCITWQSDLAFYVSSVDDAAAAPAGTAGVASVGVTSPGMGSALERVALFSSATLSSAASFSYHVAKSATRLTKELLPAKLTTAQGREYTLLLHDVFRKAQGIGPLFAVHAEDAALIRELGVIVRFLHETVLTFVVEDLARMLETLMQANEQAFLD